MKRTLIAVVSLSTIFLAPEGQAQTNDSLGGTWVLRMVTTAVSKVPVAGKVESESRFYARATLQESDGSLVMKVEPCRVASGKDSGVRPVIPAATLAIMGPKRRTGTVSGTDVAFGRAVDVLGAKLANEWTDPLPDDEDAPTHWDEDGDGKAGVTIGIVGPLDGEVYVVQRSWNALRGTANEDRTQIRGHVTWNTEQVMLGSTSVFLRITVKTTPHPDRAKNYFDMRRIPESTTCANIRRASDNYFGGGR